MKKIRSLDGIRAIAVLMVLLSHCLPSMHLPISGNKYNFLECSGKLGVSMFFVLSGYLITKLLVFERKVNGSISLKDFYLRRIFRIFPVFYLNILVIILLKCFFVPTLFESYKLVGVAAVYLWNYVYLFHINSFASDHGYAIFAHFWSLAIEEQFYLLWPIMLIKLSVAALKKIIITIIVTSTFISVVAYFLIHDNNERYITMNLLLEGGTTITMGCLGALIENTNFFNERILKIIHNNSLICFSAIFLFIISPLSMLYFKALYNLPTAGTLDGICIIILLFWCVYVPSKISDLLNSKVLVKIGILSYSLYIWQQLFLDGEFFHLWYNKFPLNIFLVFAVAFISYYLIERPILRLKKRFTRI
jgi:peptidoglycan/LPS O-acetylase OafA/YrhL